MKAFDKWLETSFYPDETSNDGDWYIAEKGWRAALKWVLKHEPDIGVTACIRKELEN